MRILIFLTTLYAALIIYSVSSSAKEEDPIALQTSDWAILTGDEGAQDVSADPEQCTMQMDYDNGFRLILKAKGDRLSALRLITTDRSNNVLKIKGFVGLGVGKNSYALQSKFDKGQIDATLVTVPKLAEKLKEATVFRLKLGVKNYYFALQGFEEGYHRFMVCKGILAPKTLKVVSEELNETARKALSHIPTLPVVQDSAMPSNPVPAVEMSEISNGEVLLPSVETSPVVAMEALKENQGVQNQDFEKIQSQPVPVKESVRPASQQIQWDATPQQQKQPEIHAPLVESADSVEMLDRPVASEKVGKPQWMASKGEKLSVVLKRWGDVAGVNTHFAMDNDPILKRDIASNGRFEVAVNILLKEAGVNGYGPSAIVKNGDGRVTHIAGNTGGVSSDVLASDDGVYRWRALQGTDLRKVLLRWSNKSDVDFVWDAPEVFLIPNSMKASVSYDRAVALILSQFEGRPVRPVATLNTDPKTGRKQLFVKTARSQ